ncbi:MAG TPA: tetratricopeptide repeat protein [Pyrinomonadaceae bacterium]|nr:tetratricopeptide repeat protein [Pyrinomonadaceae bacterium]
MNAKPRNFIYYPALLSVLLVALVSLGGCRNPEKTKAEHLSKGEAYLKESKFNEAVLEFRNALQIDDKLAPAYWGLARAYESLQRLPEMLEALRKAIDLDQNNLEAKNKLANYYLAASKGRPELLTEAERLANDVLQRDPKNIEGHILLSSVRFAQGKKDEALAELNRAIDLNPSRSESYLSLARFYMVTNDREKADEAFRKAISVEPGSALAHTEYGKYLVQTNRISEAEAELKKAVEVAAPTDRTARYSLATFYVINKQLDKAEETYKALAELDKDKPESQAILADFYSATNRSDDAVRIFQDILAKSPDYVQGRYRLAEILLMRGDTSGASAQIEEALKKDQQDRKALLLRARVRAQAGQADDLKAAVEDLKEVLKQEPSSREGLYFMAEANFNMGAIDQARVFAGDLEKNYPEYLPAKLMQVQINIAAGDPKKAVSLATDLIDRLSKTAPDRQNSPQLLQEIGAKAYLARGSAQLQLGNRAAARQDFDSSRRAAPTETRVYNNLAAISQMENKPEEAMAFYQTALKINATDFKALNGLISLYARQNQLDKAHATIDPLLNTYPNNASLHYLKAEIYGLERNAQGAEAELRKALELDRNYITAYLALGALFINSKQEDRAIAEYKRILEVRPDDSTAYTLIGMLEDSRKNYDVAAESYRKALEKDANALIAANNLAWLYADHGKGNLDEALRLAQGVVQKNPNIAGFADTLGWVYYKKGLYTPAAEQLQKAVSMDEAAARVNKGTPSATYHYHLGMALKAKGDKAGSRRELEASLRLSDKSPFDDIDEARKALASL